VTANGDSNQRGRETMSSQVVRVVTRIPAGRVTTYGRIAMAIGFPRAARIVGWTLAHLPDGVDVPAHRVVNREGRLTGAHAWGAPEIMRDLLEEEGVPFIGEWQVDLDGCVWGPSDEDPASFTTD